MKIKTWQERCEEHPDHEGIVSEQMIRCRMQEEIDELRQALEEKQEPVAWIERVDTALMAELIEKALKEKNT